MMQQCHTATQPFSYKLMFDFEQYQDRISSICKKYRVRNLTAFGSAVNEHFHEQSDIDFLIELDGVQDGLKRYMNVKFELELLLSRSVDLVMPRAIKNRRIREYIFSNTMNIYAA
jgi:predicted nucleotidyltransferase